MTFEEFKNKLLLRGVAKQAVNGPTIAKAYDVIAGAEDTTLEDYQRSLSDLQTKIDRLERRAFQLSAYEKRLDDKEDELRCLGDEIIAYITQFNDSLKECETAEGRDAVRKLQLFVNAVEVETKYDNTSYITGLWAILSGEKVAAIDKLKKMNPKLFKEEVKRL